MIFYNTYIIYIRCKIIRILHIHITIIFIKRYTIYIIICQYISCQPTLTYEVVSKKAGRFDTAHVGLKTNKSCIKKHPLLPTIAIQAHPLSYYYYHPYYIQH